MVPCTSAVIDLQRPCSTKAFLEAFKLHCQFFVEALISCSHSVTVTLLGEVMGLQVFEGLGGG